MFGVGTVMRVSDETNEDLPVLAMTTAELSEANLAITNANFRRSREIQIINPAEPDYTREVAYNQTLNIPINHSVNILDLNIDCLTVKEVKKKLEKHFKQMFPEEE